MTTTTTDGAAPAKRASAKRQRRAHLTGCNCVDCRAATDAGGQRVYASYGYGVPYRPYDLAPGGPVQVIGDEDRRAHAALRERHLWAAYQTASYGVAERVVRWCCYSDPTGWRVELLALHTEAMLLAVAAHRRAHPGSDAADPLLVYPPDVDAWYAGALPADDEPAAIDPLASPMTDALARMADERIRLGETLRVPLASEDEDDLLAEIAAATPVVELKPDPAVVRARVTSANGDGRYDVVVVDLSDGPHRGNQDANRQT